MGVERNRSNYKNQPALIVLVIILLLLVLSLGGYIIYDKITVKDKTTKESKPKEEIKVEKKAPKIAKLDESKDYVYQAEYDAGNQYTENTVGNWTDQIMLANNWVVTPILNGTTYLKDLVVPFINIDSEAAKTANDQLKALYEEYANRFDDMTRKAGTQILTYRTYLLDDTLSIVVAHGYQYTDIMTPHFVTYNFSLTDGSLLSFEQVYKIAGFSPDTINDKLFDIISTDFDQTYDYTQASEYTTLKNKTIAEYQSDLANQTFRYYLDDQTHLTIIYNKYIPASITYRYTIITVQ